ncbi:DNA polymerase I [Marinococcus luteus]|uniref:DNA polymerase I n=1 Tax=Marinococcus luteus TaxID=1122204 RepID=UPI002ACCE3F0|nr:DNA polymerase I [Marinococcus luteus]MDZ5783779.1 DNA polymerase I [Marinococcus luteus]
MSKLVLLDGNSIAYRAFFALPLLNNDKGVYTNAIYGFTTMLLKILEDEEPSHVLVAFDAGKTTFRHDTYSEYKSGREKTPSELSEQLPVIREVLDVFKVPYIEKENYEADDIIGTLSKQAEEENWDVRIYTGDRDLLQLVSPHVHVSFIKKGITNTELYDPDAIQERYGLAPLQITDMKGLMGDSSDNIPGVPGIGEKTALKLLQEYGSVDKVLESIDKISGKKMKERLEENKEQAKMSKELAIIYRNTPLDLELQQLKHEEYDVKEVTDLFRELEFQTLLNKFDDVDEAQQTFDELAYKHVTDVQEDMLVSPSALVVEVPEENYHHGSVWGIAVINETGRYFISTEDALQSEAFQKWAKDESKEKYTFDTKRAVVALGWKGVELRGITHDTLIASYLIDPSVSSHHVSDIAKRRNLQVVDTDEAVYGKGAKRTKPEEEVLAEHLIRKGEAVYRLQGKIEEDLKQNEQLELFKELEMPLSLVLGQMETQGISVDRQQLEVIGDELDGRLTELEKEIYKQAGREFNINSPKQLGPILFEELGLPAIKKTKTGYSTSADVLEKLSDQHEIIPSLLLYRQISKLRSTYIEGLLKVIHPTTGKIHTMFNQAITQTGRLSSTEPNLQNIPIRLEEGRRIRKAFIPSESGWSILSADYSQIELRVLAHIADDEGLKGAFQNNMDIHTKTAMDVFGVGHDEVTSNMRRSAKAVNFGIVYGISDYGLSQSLGITRNEAKEFIETYLKSYPNVQNYMNEIKDEARRDGFVTTLLHRRRYLPDMNSRNFNQRSFAERTAMNTPIQGTAADIIKKAMVDVSKALEEKGLNSRLLLQVHDELIFEVPENEVKTMQELVPELMEQTIELSVPLKADVAQGPTWYDAK